MVKYNVVKIFDIKGVGRYTKYHINRESNNNEKPIFKSQIIGKVIKVVDGNIWSELSIKIWEITIHNLNVRG